MMSWCTLSRLGSESWIRNGFGAYKANDIQAFGKRSGQDLSDRRACYRGLDLRLQLFLAGLEIVLEVPLLLVVVGHLLRDLGLVRIALHA